MRTGKRVERVETGNLKDWKLVQRTDGKFKECIPHYFTMRNQSEVVYLGICTQSFDIKTSSKNVVVNSTPKHNCWLRNNNNVKMRYARYEKPQKNHSLFVARKILILCSGTNFEEEVNRKND